MLPEGWRRETSIWMVEMAAFRLFSSSRTFPPWHWQVQVVGAGAGVGVAGGGAGAGMAGGGVAAPGLDEEVVEGKCRL